MNNKFLKCCNSFFFFMCVYAVFVIASCKKPAEDTSVEVTCIDIMGKPVDSAKVVFYVDGNAQSVGLPNTQITKADGKASIEFRNGILLDVRASKHFASPRTDSIWGKSIILLNPGDHIERTLKLQ